MEKRISRFAGAVSPGNMSVAEGRESSAFPAQNRANLLRSQSVSFRTYVFVEGRPNSTTFLSHLCKRNLPITMVNSA